MAEEAGSQMSHGYNESQLAILFNLADEFSAYAKYANIKAIPLHIYFDHPDGKQMSFVIQDQFDVDVDFMFQYQSHANRN